MTVQRMQVGEVHHYKGRKIMARFAGPDLLGYVNDVELSGFYIDVAAVRAAGERYVDAEDKAQADAAARNARAR